MSKLIYNVHVWSVFEAKPRSILNSVYMRLWRRIANEPRFQRCAHTDLEIRRQLGVPSLDCLTRKRRLKYLSRMLRSDVQCLQVLLQCKNKDGSRLPWAELMINDFCVLYDALPRIFKELTNPRVYPDAFCRIARDQPREWSAIVDMYVQYCDDVDDKCIGTSCKR